MKRAENAEDEKPIRLSGAGHECGFCSRRFAFKSDLDVHSNALHTKERSFGCKECPKRFYHRSSLRVHIRYVWRSDYEMLVDTGIPSYSDTGYSDML